MDGASSTNTDELSKNLQEISLTENCIRSNKSDGNKFFAKYVYDLLNQTVTKTSTQQIHFLSHHYIPVQFTLDKVPIVAESLSSDFVGMGVELPWCCLKLEQWRALEEKNLRKENLDDNSCADGSTVLVNEKDREGKPGDMEGKENIGKDKDFAKSSTDDSDNLNSHNHRNSTPSKSHRTRLQTLQEVISQLRPSDRAIIQVHYPSPYAFQQNPPLLGHPSRNTILDAVLSVLGYSPNSPSLHNNTENLLQHPPSPTNQQEPQIRQQQTSPLFALASPDADLCLYLNLKQNRYPVYLTLSTPSLLKQSAIDLTDPRLLNLTNILQYCSSQHIDGIINTFSLKQTGGTFGDGGEFERVVELVRSRGLKLISVVNDFEGGGLEKKEKITLEKVCRVGVDGVLFRREGVVADWICDPFGNFKSCSEMEGLVESDGKEEEKSGKVGNEKKEDGGELGVGEGNSRVGSDEEGNKEEEIEALDDEGNTLHRSVSWAEPIITPPRRASVEQFDTVEQLPQENEAL